MNSKEIRSKPTISRDVYGADEIGQSSSRSMENKVNGGVRTHTHTAHGLDKIHRPLLGRLAKLHSELREYNALRLHKS